MMALKQVKTKPPKKHCPRCDKDYDPVAWFYTADEMIYPDGRFHICKHCVEDIIDIKGFNGFMALLRAMNKPFLQEIYSDDWKSYIRQISSLPQYRGKTYDDSVFDRQFQTMQQQSNTQQATSDSNYTSDELSQMESFWGKGINNEDLEFLQNEYQKFLNSYECDSYAMELLFQEAAQQRLTIKKARKDNKSVDKELKTLQDILGSANIKPAQETGANSTEQATFGTLIKKYENERPIPEPDPAWQDVDGIKKYIQVWFLGHLCRMMGINNEYARLYEEELAKHTVESIDYQDDSELEDGELK